MLTRELTLNGVVCGCLAVACILLSGSVAFGVANPEPPASSQNSGSLVSGRDAQDPDKLTVRVTRDQCAGLLKTHRPSDDVTFRPGSDGRGGSVAPADLEDWSRWSGGVEDSFVFYLSIDPFDRRGNSRLRRLDSPHLPIGALSYDSKTGLMTLDGRPISGNQEAELVRACREAGYKP